MPRKRLEGIKIGKVEDLPTLLLPEQIKQYFKIGNDKLYELLHRRDFPSIQIGGCFYIISDDFIEWIREETKKKK